MSVLCVGEPLVTLTPPPYTSLGIAEAARIGIGGAELNVAVHLARLGVAVAYAGIVGADPFGTRIREELIEEGVDCALLRSGPGATGLYAKEPGRTLYYREGSAGSRLRAVHPPDGVDHLHLTGVTFGLRGAIASAAEELCLGTRSWTLSFDLNYRPALWPAAVAGPTLLRIARAADLVLLGRDEAVALWDLDDSDDIRTCLGTDAELVIKDGAAAVDIWAEGRWWRSAPPAVDIAEPVGAGDAFAAAYLTARRAGQDPTSAAEAGHRLAGHVMGTLSDHGVRGAAVYRDLGAD